MQSKCSRANRRPSRGIGAGVDLPVRRGMLKAERRVEELAERTEVLRNTERDESAAVWHSMRLGQRAG